jgi:hypothetical protein
MFFIRWMLALVTIAYAAFNSIAPATTLLYKLKAQWPAGWAGVQPVLGISPGDVSGADGGRFEALMQATNWVQLGLWLAANLLYVLAAIDLIGRQPKDAPATFGVAVLLDWSCWLTFKRMPVYDLTVSPQAQQLNLAIFAIMAGVGIFVWLSAQTSKQKQIHTSSLAE